MYKIEKDIPITPSVKRPRLYPFDKMEIGDSFIVGDYTRENMQSISGAAWYFKSRNKGYNFSFRKTHDNKIRVWRVE